MPNSYTLIGATTFRGDSGAGNALVVADNAGTARLTVANTGRATLGQDTTVSTEVCAVITTDVANANLVIAPNGNGALIADIPDGTAAGGNARGDNAVDLQTSRNTADKVASGSNSVIVGGLSNRATSSISLVCGGATNSATAIYSSVVGGELNTASGAHSSVVGGQSNTASGTYSFANGLNQTASGGSSIALGGTAVYGSSSASSTGSVVIGGGGLTANGDGAMALQIQNISQSTYGLATGFRSISYLFGQNSRANGQFAERSDAQTSSLNFRRSITGTGISELFLDGASIRAILNITSGPTNARAWRAQIDLVAICSTAATSGGTLALNDCFVGSYLVGIKNVGGTASLIGTVFEIDREFDATMSDAIVTITAAGNYLKIEFTPPTTSDASSVIRVVATAYLTEVGR